MLLLWAFVLREFFTKLEKQVTPVTDDQVFTFFDAAITVAGVSAIDKNARVTLASQLNYFLASVVSGSATTLLRANEKIAAAPNGFETWRLIANKILKARMLLHML